MKLQGFDESTTTSSMVDLNEDVRQRCFTAKQHEAVGDYERARATLGNRWKHIGERPDLDGLDHATAAELLLRVGTLSGWIGSAGQIEGGQETAKDLISESSRMFEQMGLVERQADAQVDLAVCYWREGGLDEARVTLQGVLDKLGQENCEPRLRALANMGLLERVAGRYQEALQIQTDAAPLFEESSNHALRGTFHNVYGQLLKEIGLAEQREDYVDRALVEYSAASYHFEQAGHVRFQGRVENNLGLLLGRVGRFVEAYEHLSRARSVFIGLKDKGSVAQVDEGHARTLLAEGRSKEAETMVRASVRVLEHGDERSTFAEALTTHATALARLGRSEEARQAFDRAIAVAGQAGDPHISGLAALSFIEEFKGLLPEQLRHYYYRAESLLRRAQDRTLKHRLGECARKILTLEAPGNESAKTEVLLRPLANEPNRNRNSEVPVQSFTAAEQPPAFSLEQQVLSYEGDLIKRALDASGGSVTRAARMLGITHQGLAFILNGRHRSLLSARKPAKPRRRSIVRYH